MVKTTECPTCHKKLPLLAVRCKYCGFKLSKNSDVQTDTVPMQSSALTSSSASSVPMARISTASPVIAPKPSSAIDSPSKRVSKKTILGIMAPSADHLASYNKNKSDKLTEPHVAKPHVPRPHVPKPHASSVSAPEKLNHQEKLAKPPSVLTSSLNNVDKSISTTNDDWIPEFDEVSQLISLDDENTENVKHIEQSSNSTPNDIEAKRLNILKNAQVKSFIALLFKRIFNEQQIENFETKYFPRKVLKILAKTKLIHAIGAGMSFFAILMIVILVPAGNHNEDGSSSKNKQSSVQINNKKINNLPGKINRKKNFDKSKKIKSDQSSFTQKTAPSTDNTTVSCHSLDSYPDFLWKDKIQTLLNSAGQESICQIFGSLPESISDTYSSMIKVGPVGYDPIDGAKVLEIYPTDKALRLDMNPAMYHRSPVMEFVFLKDKLFQLTLDYVLSKKSILDATAIVKMIQGKVAENKEKIEVPVEKTKDHLGNNITKVVDGNLIIEIIKDQYGRKSLRFTSKTVIESLETELAKLKKAQKLISAGDKFMRKKKYSNSIKKYEKAEKILPAYGAIYIQKALCFLLQNQYQKLTSTANKALKVSLDSRIHSKANEFLAVVALFKGDKAKAILHYKAAFELDNANVQVKEYAHELETGKYTLARVAKTTARMTCLSKLKSPQESILARGNFISLKEFFAALGNAKKDSRFSVEQKIAIKKYCR